MLIDCHAAFGTSEDDERSNMESQALPSQAHPPPQYLQQPPADSSHADLDILKVMLAVGGANYETVLRDANMHKGPDSENIPSDQCGGEARRVNLKRKARYITRSVAEMHAYYTDVNIY